LRVQGKVKYFSSIKRFKAITEGTRKVFRAEFIHLFVYSTAQAFPTYVKTNASCHDTTSMGLKEESSFKTLMWSIKSSVGEPLNVIREDLAYQEVKK